MAKSLESARVALDNTETVGEVMKYYYSLLQKNESDFDKYLDETMPGHRGEAVCLLSGHGGEAVH